MGGQGLATYIILSCLGNVIVEPHRLVLWGFDVYPKERDGLAKHQLMLPCHCWALSLQGAMPESGVRAGMK